MIERLRGRAVRAACSRSLVALAVSLAAACGDDDGAMTGTPPPPPGADTCIPQRHGGGGYLRTELSGAYEQSVDFGPEVQCGGTADASMRSFAMAFAKEIAPEQSLTFTWTIAGGEGETGEGLSARLTLGGSAFIDLGGVASIPDGGCTVDVTEHELLQSEVTGRLYRVTATGSCTMGADPILGDETIDVADFELSGVTVWTGEAP